MLLLEKFRYARWIWNARRAKPVEASDAEPGIGAVRGVARAATDYARAPFTGRACVFWVAALTKKEIGTDIYGRETEVWHEAFRAASQLPFDLVDRHGSRVTIVPSAVSVLYDLADVSSHPRVNDDNPLFDSFLRQNGVAPTAFMGLTNDHRFEERCTTDTDELLIYGHIETSTSVRAEGYRDAPNRTLHLVAKPNQPLVLLPPPPPPRGTYRP